MKQDQLFGRTRCMQRLSADEFTSRYPRPALTDRILADPESPATVVAGDVILDGLAKSVTVRRGARVVITGLVKKSLVIECEAVVYVEGLIDGRVTLDGAMFVAGHVAGAIRGPRDLFDPIP